ncbi:MAG TPA: zf-HC2 domain-containing protein [Anaerolineae bacterium]|nr:zf-HC2 domain-containing protein [Anaerolineae bacterium]
MKTNNHVTHQIPNYLLDLLPPAEHQQVAQHLDLCPTCRQQLITERRLTHTIKQTIQIATTPPPQIQNQRWTGSKPTYQWPLTNFIRRPATSVALLILILVTSLNWFTPPAIAAVPQPTSMSTMSNQTTINISRTPMANHISHDDFNHHEHESSPLFVPVHTPIPPPPTPIAALLP